MAQWLRILTALTKDPSSVPGIHVRWFTARDFDALFWLTQAPGTHAVHGHAHRQNNHTQKQICIVIKL